VFKPTPFKFVEVILKYNYLILRMRLLKRKNTGEFSLTNLLVSGDIPRYAILSHTWGADTEEVSFKDMIDGTGKRKTGYDKIRFCGEQAGRDGLQYFWIDTCCIDKSSSSELQEAINSMFRWYRDAAKCYVYMADIWQTSSPASCPGNRLFGRAGGSPGDGPFKSLLLRR
jgi:heterokaryon incompatibility protein (HET)